MEIYRNVQLDGLSPEGMIRRAVVVRPVCEVVIYQCPEEAEFRYTALEYFCREEGVCHGEDGESRETG